MDYQGTLLFSLLLSIVNTTGYYVMTVYNLKKKIDEEKNVKEDLRIYDSR